LMMSNAQLMLLHQVTQHDPFGELCLARPNV